MFVALSVRTLSCLLVVGLVGCDRPPALGVTGPAPVEQRLLARPPTRAKPAPEPSRRLRVGCWIPFWHKAAGARRVRNHIRLFDEISPFAYLVHPDGRLRDMTRDRPGDWRRLFAAARPQGVEIIPTVVWQDGNAIHALLNHRFRRRAHVKALVKLVTRRRFAGIDINYEGKRVEDRDRFTRFLGELGDALHAQGAKLVCTVETRSTDQPPANHSPAASMAWANDYEALGRVCDRVRLMAYDQWFATHGSSHWTGTTREPHAPGSGVRWVEQVVRRALRHIPAHKLELGVPTYGWLFELKGKPTQWSYRRHSALSYVRTQRLITRFKAKTQRAAGGELKILYSRRGERRVGYLADAASVRAKFRLARRLGLRGVVLFKVEGEEDPALWEVLAGELWARLIGITPS